MLASLSFSPLFFVAVNAAAVAAVAVALDGFLSISIHKSIKYSVKFYPMRTIYIFEMMAARSKLNREKKYARRIKTEYYEEKRHAASHRR